MTTQVNRLLVVDDNETNRAALGSYLESEGMTVEIGCDGQEAIDMLDSRQYDLVLLGVNLPKLSGYQVLEHKKADPVLQETPVIMVSSIGDLDSVARCIELGADDYIQEPFTHQLVDMRIRITMQKHDIEQEQDQHIKRVEKLADQ